jgi:hypothetical protein
VERGGPGIPPLSARPARPPRGATRALQRSDARVFRAFWRPGIHALAPGETTLNAARVSLVLRGVVRPNSAQITG